MSARTVLVALATFLLLTPVALANYCPAGPLGQRDIDYNVYLEVKGTESRVLEVRKILHASASNCKVVMSNATMFTNWYKCDPSIASGNWPVELNHCPSGYVQGSTPRNAGGGKDKTAAAPKCSKKDIEGNWRRTSDGSQVRISAMFRKDGGQALMHKYGGSIRWPQPVSKFYSVKQIGKSCDFKARCTTVRMRRNGKNYNFSAEPCTIRLSADKKKITTSDGSGTWTRGWK